MLVDDCIFSKNGSQIDDTINILKDEFLLEKEAFRGLNMGCSKDVMITLIKKEIMDNLLDTIGILDFNPMTLSENKATI